MKLPHRRFLHLAAGAATLIFAVLLTGEAAWSQTIRTIKIVVPLPAGSAADIMSRLFAEQISRAQRVTILVENRPGAAETIGTEAVARAAPDGNTLLLTTYNAIVISPQLRKVAYEPLTSFEPICHLVNAPIILTVSSASPYRSFADLLDAARSKPGDLTIAGVGPATGAQVDIEKLKRMANVNMTFVPFPGIPPAVNALLGGHVTSVFGNYAAQAEQINAGKLRALAAATRMRIERLPELPTIAESGFEDYAADLWFGLYAPAKTPKETAAQLAGWFTAAMQAPEVKPKLAALDLHPVGTCGADFAAQLRKQYDDYGRIIREANIRPE